jgi:type I restriction enzyme S subunit
VTDLPGGWSLVALGDIVDVLDSYRVPVNAAERAKRPGGVPYYGATGQVGWIDEPLFTEELVLLGEDGAPFLDASKPKAYVISGPSWVNNHAHVLRARAGATTSPYLKYALDALDYRPHVNGTTRLKLTQKAMSVIRLPMPALSEQDRIVAAIEEHLSRLDAAVAAMQSAERRVSALEKAIITTASSTVAPPSGWQIVTVAQAGRVSLGLQRSPKRHSGPSMRPYIRVANVFEDRIDGGDVMTMDMTDAEWARFRLRNGDVLLNEGQSPEYLGRPAIYRGEPPDVAFTNSLIRFQANEDVDPEWALLVFRSHMHNRRFMRESQITTNIAHLAAGRFKTVEFPLPPLDEQRARVADARKGLEACARLRIEITRAKKRSAALRRSILAAAFAGKLVPQDPDDEPASALLARIRAAREAEPPVRRARRGVRGSVS